jgi:ABC-type Zn2+ transport system substrate-binding protein/surface adhesin
MELAGRYLPNQYQRQVVAYPHELAPGKYVDQYVVNQSDVTRYKQGDHLIWGGPKVGMFWASDVQTLESLVPKSIEHAYAVTKTANKNLVTLSLDKTKNT